MQPRSFFAELRTPSMERMHVFHQFIYVPGAAVGEFLLRQRPNALIGIEFRRVGRKVFDVQAAMVPLKLLR